MINQFFKWESDVNSFVVLYSCSKTSCVTSFASSEFFVQLYATRYMVSMYFSAKAVNSSFDIYVLSLRPYIDTMHKGADFFQIFSIDFASNLGGTDCRIFFFANIPCFRIFYSEILRLYKMRFDNPENNSILGAAFPPCLSFWHHSREINSFPILIRNFAKHREIQEQGIKKSQRGRNIPADYNTNTFLKLYSCDRRTTSPTPSSIIVG